MTIDRIRERCASLHVELAEEYHRAGCGLREGLDTTSILERYDDLVGLPRVEQVRDAQLAAADPREQERLALLLEHVAWIYEAHRGRTVTDRVQNEEGAAAIEVDGETIPYRALPVHIVNEPDRARRERLAAARNEVMERLEPIYLEQIDLTQAVARELGYENHNDRCGTLGRLPLVELREATHQLLERTEAIYDESLGALLAAHGLDPAEASWADLAWLFRVDGYDGAFPGEELVGRMSAMVEAMGLDIHAGGHVSFDLEDRPLKSPRPFCSVLEVPQRVVLVLRPVGGLSDYAAFLHELGHALHFGYSDPELPWEFRHLGDNSVTESYAFLFDRLSVSRTWLGDYLPDEEAHALAKVLGLRELMMVRKYSAQLAYEIDLFSADEPKSKQAGWVRRIEEATGVRQPPGNYLPSVDPLFYSARYLQGWLFEAALSEQLVDRFGDHWYRTEGAGEVLLGLYRRGQDRRMVELFHEFSIPPLDIDPFLRRAERELT